MPAGRSSGSPRRCSPGASYDDISALAGASPAGANGVLFTPWLTGERSPVDDKQARAGFHNVSLTTTRADLARAVLEGVAFNLRWLLDGAEHFTRTRLDPLRVLGEVQRGWTCGARSLPTSSTARSSASTSRWSAVCAAPGCTPAWPSATYARTSCAASCPSTASSRRTPTTRATYDPLAGELPRLYRRQKRMFARLNG